MSCQNHVFLVKVRNSEVRNAVHRPRAEQNNFIARLHSIECHISFVIIGQYTWHVVQRIRNDNRSVTPSGLAMSMVTSGGTLSTQQHAVTSIEQSAGAKFAQ